jgi:hypothetical protein
MTNIDSNNEADTNLKENEMNDKETMLAKFENMGMSSTISSDMASNMGLYVGDWIDRSYHYWYPGTTITYSNNRQDTFKQAFKIVSMMIEKGYLDKITLKKFITLVKEVESEL